MSAGWPLSAPAGTGCQPGVPLELPACSQHVSKDAGLVLQRMLSRRGGPRAARAPWAHPHTEPAPGALLVPNQPFSWSSVCPGREAKGDVLYLCLMLLRYRYQNVPGNTPDIQYCSEPGAALPPLSSLPSRRSRGARFVISTFPCCWQCHRDC